MIDASKKDLLVMKFLHYFITEQNYNPVVVHGVQNEIWLENMNSEFKIVRLVLGYIHNNEQLDFDNFKVQRLTIQIKFKTFSFSMKVLSFYLDINDDVKLESTKLNTMIKIKTEKSINKNEIINKYFSDMPSKLVFTEEGAKLYEKINNDILRKNMVENEKMGELFKEKKPYVTYALIFVMIIFILLMSIFGNGSTDINTLYYYGALVKDKNILRLFLSMFLHIGLIHLLMNAWALKIIGTQIERFYGHVKMLIIFIYSGVIGNLLSLLFMNDNVVSAGASGAIFGLMGALLYFAINQRTYMQDALRREILPVIIINLMLGFIIPGINMLAHIGGLLAGIFISMAVGIKYKSSNAEKRNGIITSIILLVFLLYLVYFK